MTRGQLSERLGQPCMRIDAGDLAVLDEHGDVRPVFVAFIGTGEQGILPIERDA